MTPPITSFFGPEHPLVLVDKVILRYGSYTSAAEAVPPGTHRLSLLASPTYPIITTPLQLMARQETAELQPSRTKAEAFWLDLVRQVHCWHRLAQDPSTNARILDASGQGLSPGAGESAKPTPPVLIHAICLDNR